MRAACILTRSLEPSAAIVSRSSATTRIWRAASSARSLSQLEAVRRERRSTCSIRRMSPGLASDRSRNSAGRASFAPLSFWPGGCDQTLDLLGGQVLAGAALGMRDLLGQNCPILRAGVLAGAVVLLIARGLSHIPDCPRKGPIPLANVL